MTMWQCSKCGFTNEQPDHAVAVYHRCPKAARLNLTKLTMSPPTHHTDPPTRRQ